MTTEPAPVTPAGQPNPVDGLAQEQAHLARVRAARAVAVRTAHERIVTDEHVAADRYSAESLGRMIKSQARELALEGDVPPYFGRLDFDDSAAAGPHAGQRYYVGRRRITDEERVPLVVDWRAPVARAFYQATADDRQGVALRRRFGWGSGGRDQPPDLSGYEDERLTSDRPTATDTGTGAGGLSRLVRQEIERPRVGPMRDIVATISPEQDTLVRAELERSICVQGGPGTGKTAVGLHRAAYLLYTHRRELERGGVLVLGPNRAFLRHIAAVLPVLGELTVTHSTLEALLTGPALVAGTDGTTRVEADAVAAVKHDVRMSEVLRRALYSHTSLPTEPLVVPDGPWRLTVSALRRLVAGVRAEQMPYGTARERLRAGVVALLRRQVESRGTSPGGEWTRRMGRSRPVTAFLDATWPAVRPADLLGRLLGDRDALAAAADGVLTEAEQDLLHRVAPAGRGRARAATGWSAADLVLLDEIAGLVERPPAFGHVIVDEAQDLSPMQCRAVARRSHHGSLTVLGDLAQGTTPWAARDWTEQLAHLGKPDATVVSLTTGFRVPAGVAELANRLLRTLDVDLPEIRSPRTDGRVTVRPVESAADLATATVAAARAALDHEGSVAVVAIGHELPRLAAALHAAGIAADTAPGAEPAAAAHSSDTGVKSEPDGVTARLTLLPAALAKGLEYDQVIVVEPADIVDAEPRGTNRLYVALTRAVSRLDVLHHRPLPAALDPAAGSLRPADRVSA